MSNYVFIVDNIKIPRTIDKVGHISIVCESMPYDDTRNRICVSQEKGIFIEMYGKNKGTCIVCTNPHRLKPIDIKFIDTYNGNKEFIIDAIILIMTETIALPNRNVRMIVNKINSESCFVVEGEWDGDPIEGEYNIYNSGEVNIIFNLNKQGYSALCQNPRSITMDTYMDIKKKLIELQDWDSQEFKYLKAIHDIIKFSYYAFANKTYLGYIPH